MSTVESTESVRHRPNLGDAFTAVDSMTVDWAVSMAIRDLADLVTTRSYFLTASSSDQQTIRDDVGRVLDRHFPIATSVDVPYRTYCYRASRS